MSPLSAIAVPVLSAFAYPQDNNVVFARQNNPSPSSGSAAPASSAAASSAAPASSASGAAPATSNVAAPTNLPNVSGSSTISASAAATTDAAGNTRTFPTLTDGQVYSYPPPTVPPTANAPFMQKSTLPNGTVFISVGSIIGFFFVAVFIWRAWAVWALHRRMNAANVEYVGVSSAPPTVTGSGLGHDRKSAVLRKSGTGFYSQTGAGSGYNMGELPKKSSDHGHRSHRGASKAEYSAAIGGGNGLTKGAAAARQSSLFFSPTAGAGAHGTAAQRASAYLPAGFYAAGSTAAGSTVVNANSTSDLTTNPSRSQLSMADFHPPQRASYGYKDSPLLRPQSSAPLEPPNAPFGRHSVGRNSSSSLGQNSERAPSAYLEDLFNTTPTENRGSDERRRY